MTKNIYLKDIVGEKAIEITKGEQVRGLISSYFKDDYVVEVYFDGMTSILTMFLNPAFGDLYADFSEEFIKKHLSVKNVPNEYLDLFKRVLDRAKDFYKDKEKMTKILDEALDDDKMC